MAHKRIFDQNDEYIGNNDVQALLREADGLMSNFIQRHTEAGYSARDLAYILADSAYTSACEYIYCVLAQTDNAKDSAMRKLKRTVDPETESLKSTPAILAINEDIRRTIGRLLNRYYVQGYAMRDVMWMIRLESEFQTALLIAGRSAEKDRKNARKRSTLNPKSGRK